MSSITDPIIKQLRKSIPESEARLRQLNKEIIPDFIKPYHDRICELIQENLESDIKFLKKMEGFKNEEMKAKFKKKSMNNLIGVSGGIKAGKDLVGQMIQYIGDEPNEPTFEGFDDYINTIHTTQKYQIKKCADKLKDCLCLILGCTRKQLEDRDYKNTELGKDWWYYLSPANVMIPYKDEYIIDGVNRPLPECDLVKLTPRMMLQLLGTEGGRMVVHPNIWVSALFSDFDDEKWENIIDYEESYQISNYGNVRSLDREITYGKNKGDYHTKVGQKLKPTKSGNYLTISLSGKTFTVHSLVAKHFCDNYIDGYVVNHKDFNTINNYYKNLEWVTQSDNIKHNKKYLKGAFGENQSDSKLTDIKVLMIKELLNSPNVLQSEIAKQFKVSQTTITDIKKGRKWSHVGIKKEIINPITPPNWVITDIRFPDNEGKAVSDRGGLLIGVRRHFELRFPEYSGITNLGDLDDGYEIPNNLEKIDPELYATLNHESESLMGDHSWCDVIIENNGTTEELFNNVLKAVYYKKELV